MGSVVISLDAELGWGFHHRWPLPTERIRRARENWRPLVALFEEFDVPATWAVVGHLLLDSCETTHWYHPAGDRCCTTGTTDADPQELWFAGELVDAVKTSTVDHEIACHGFTHLHFEHQSVTRRVAREELRESVESARGRGIEPTTFVFPVNRVYYRDVLREFGFECYRGVNPIRSTAVARWGPLWKILQATTGYPSPPVSRPRLDERGLVSVPASLYLFGFEGRARRTLKRVWDDPVVVQAERGVDRACDEDGVFHLWLHPHNVRSAADFDRLRAILSYIDRRRAGSSLRVETMEAVAHRTDGQGYETRPPSTADDPN